MYATITSAYPLRDKLMQSSFHFPQFSQEIEKRLAAELESLSSRNSPFKLTLEITKK